MTVTTVGRLTEELLLELVTFFVVYRMLSHVHCSSSAPDGCGVLREGGEMLRGTIRMFVWRERERGGERGEERREGEERGGGRRERGEGSKRKEREEERWN